LPYYEDPCFQSNQTQGCQVYNQYSAAIRVITEWAVPTPGQLVTLRVAALADILVGSFIWNPDYGYFSVEVYDPEGQQIKVQAVAGYTATVGTSIPGCTKFILTPNTILDTITELQAEIAVLQTEITVLETDITVLENNITQLNLGWVTVSETGTYLSASAFRVPGDITEFLRAGQKVKLLLDGTAFYANVASWAFGAGVTTISILINTDYVLTNNVITKVQLSNVNPVDFPAFFNYNLNASGFSSLIYNLGRYVVQGDIVRGEVQIGGTSNSTALTIAIPAPPNTLGMIGAAYQVADNGTGSVNVGIISATSPFTATIYKDQNFGTWTAANLKQAICEYSYIIDQ